MNHKHFNRSGNHQYHRLNFFQPLLDIEGPDGKSRRAKVWDVAVR